MKTSVFTFIDALPLELFVASAEASVVNGVPLRKRLCLTVGSLTFLGT